MSIVRSDGKERLILQVLLLALLILGFFIRSRNLAERSVWFDEAFSWMLADQFSSEEMIARTAADVHPPLYYAVLRIWIDLFGDSAFAMRMMSVLFAVLTLWGLYLLCRDCFSNEYHPSSETTHQKSPLTSRQIGLIAVGALAVSGYHIHWSRETRMYTLATTLAVFTAWFLWRALESRTTLQSRLWWSLYAISTACFLYTHNYSLFTVLGEGFCALICLAWKSHWSIRNTLLTTRFWHATAAFAFVGWAYIPWFPILLFQKEQVQDNYWISKITWWTIPDSWCLLIFPENDYVVSSHLLSLLLSVTICLMVIYFLRRPTRNRIFLAVLALTPVLCATLISLGSVAIIVPRHFLFSYLFLLCILGGVACDLFAGYLRYGFLAWLLMNGLVIQGTYDAELDVPHRPGIRGAVEALKTKISPGDYILVKHPCIFFSVKYYLRDFSGYAPPKLYLPSGATLHFTGGPILQSKDIVGPEDVQDWQGKTMWVFDTSGFGAASATFEIPRSWQQDESSRSTFKDVYFFQKEVFLTKCHRREHSPVNLISGVSRTH